MKRELLIFAGIASLSGCINITTELQPANPTVRPVIEGHDCTPIIAGIGIGTNRMAAATIGTRATETRTAIDPHRSSTPTSIPITKIHSVAIEEIQFLIFGGRCLLVTGEP